MKIQRKLVYLSTVAGLVMILALFSSVQAAAPTSLTLTNTAGDAVQVTVAGTPNSGILLSFLPPGASTVTTIVFGTTDANGNFSNSISSGGYGIPPGAAVYAAVNGLQSATALWPSYSSTLSLNQTSVQVAVGQTITVGASHTLILAANSASANMSASVSGSQVTITGVSAGSGTITLCSAAVGCGSIAVTVGAQTTQSQTAFNQNNITLNAKQSQSINISGGSRNGYTIASNSNPTSVSANIASGSSIISLYGNDTAGTATIVVCSVDSGTNCANLTVAVLAPATTALSFSQNNLSLIAGQTQSVTVSGGPDNNYFLSSNSNSGIAQAAVSGNTVTVVGGSNAGITTIAVCSASANATCGNLTVTLNTTPTAAAGGVVAFSKTVVSISQGETTTVTVTGGGFGSYVLSSNSNANAVTATIASSSNILTLYGNSEGSSIVSVCSTTTGVACAGLHVTVGPALAAIAFSQNDISLKSGQKIIVAVSGGAGSGKVISGNSNPYAASASLSSNGEVIVITGEAEAGSATITVCSKTASSNCADLRVTVSAPVIPVTNAPAASTTINKSPSEKKSAVKPAKKAAVLGASAFKFTQLLKLGSTGKEVSELQKVLKKLGYFTRQSVTDLFGPITKKAVIAFQKAKGLAPYPGWVGPATREALNKISQ